MPDFEAVRELQRIDQARAGRAALASLDRDAGALNLVIREADQDQAGNGIVRLIVALAAQSAVLAHQQYGDDAAVPMLHQISVSLGDGSL